MTNIIQFLDLDVFQLYALYLTSLVIFVYFIYRIINYCFDIEVSFWWYLLACYIIYNIVSLFNYYYNTYDITIVEKSN
ncbi:hypothetical protein Klosneuvirus_3_107 [Klosneuvirus KNV1]|uniref:Uncharacterized protein n=1 Tax=Klosneuvirus KNV1 TaxID=1977640 RepID=A0A1V0SJS7_9VIRU|nr:hypothetical protein Klosneuvirus_3_107 [Klosneuvirus KNV1]